MPLKNTTCLRISQLVTVAISLGVEVLAMVLMGLAINEFSNPVKEAIEINEEIFQDGDIYINAQYITIGLYMVLIVCAICIISSLVIALSAVIEHKKTMAFALACTVLIAVATLITAVLVMFSAKRAEDLTGNTFNKAMEKYGLLHETKPKQKADRFVDAIQIKGSCCGYTGYEDYKKRNGLEFQDIKGSKSRISFLNCPLMQVPPSCCIPADGDHPDYACSCKVFNGAPSNMQKINTKGCKDKLGDVAIKSQHLVGGLTFALFGLLVIIGILLTILWRNIEHSLSLLDAAALAQAMASGKINVSKEGSKLVKADSLKDTTAASSLMKQPSKKQKTNNKKTVTETFQNKTAKTEPENDKKSKLEPVATPNTKNKIEPVENEQPKDVKNDATKQPKAPEIAKQPKTPDIAKQPKTPEIAKQPKTPEIAKQPMANKPEAPEISKQPKANKPEAPEISKQPKTPVMAKQPKEPGMVKEHQKNPKEEQNAKELVKK